MPYVRVKTKSDKCEYKNAQFEILTDSSVVVLFPKGSDKGVILSSSAGAIVVGDFIEFDKRMMEPFRGSVKFKVDYLG